MVKRFLFCMAVVAAFSGCSAKQDVIKPVQREITEAVYASGTLVPEQEYKVVSRLEGFLTETLVDEGDTVVVGQLLFKVSNSNKDVAQETASAYLRKTTPAGHS